MNITMAQNQYTSYFEMNLFKKTDMLSLKTNNCSQCHDWFNWFWL